MKLRRYKRRTLARIGNSEVLTLTLPLHVIANLKGSVVDGLIVRALRQYLNRQDKERAARR